MNKPTKLCSPSDPGYRRSNDELERIRNEIRRLMRVGEDLSPFKLRENNLIEQDMVWALLHGPIDLKQEICGHIKARGSNLGSTRPAMYSAREVLRAVVGANAMWFVDSVSKRKWDKAERHLQRALRVDFGDREVAALQRDLLVAGKVLSKSKAFMARSKEKPEC